MGIEYDTRTMDEAKGVDCAIQLKPTGRSSLRHSGWRAGLQWTRDYTLGLVFARSTYEPVVDETDTSIMGTLLAFSAIMALIAVFCLVMWWIGG